MNAFSAAAGRNDWNRHCIGYGTCELDVVSASRSITVDAGEQYLTGAFF